MRDESLCLDPVDAGNFTAQADTEPEPPAALYKLWATGSAQRV